jgi:hypothetical protein
LSVGVAHDAERLASLGEVPVGPVEYERIREGSAGCVLLTTNVGSHVNPWHYRQPVSLAVSAHDLPEDVAAWAHHHAGAPERDPKPWLRLRLDPAMLPESQLEVLRAAAVVDTVAVAVLAEHGVEVAHQAIELAAEGGARAVVVEGQQQSSTEARATSPGLLNYYQASDARTLLEAARVGGVAIEPAFKVDTDSVANQIWSGLRTAREMGFHLGKYGLFPLTLQDASWVIGRIQRWFSDWAVAPAIYLDVPTLDGEHIYELEDAPTAARRWIEVAAEAGASIVLIDTVEKSQGLHLVQSDPDDEDGILSWENIDGLQAVADSLGVRVLWAGGISLAQLRGFGRRRPFGVYVTSAVSRAMAPRVDERDIGLTTIKEPTLEKIALAKLLLEAGFFDDETLSPDADAAEGSDAAAAARLSEALHMRWRQRFEVSER